MEVLENENMDKNDDAGDYVTFKHWCFQVDFIIAHTENQGSFAQICYKEL